MHTARDTLQRRKILLVGLSVLAGMTLLVILVVGLLPAEPFAVRTTPPGASEAAIRQFINVVIFGVDDLSQAPAALEAVWIGTFDLGINDGVLLGLPRTFDLNNGLSMAQAFSWSEESRLDPAFLDTVEETLALDFDTVVVMDRDCFRAGIDFIGGVPMETGQRLNGSAALALHALSADDPWTALEIQAEILSRARPRLDDLGPQPDLTPLLHLTPEHCWLTITDETALVMMLDMFPMDEDSIRVETIGDTNN